MTTRFVLLTALMLTACGGAETKATAGGSPATSAAALKEVDVGVLKAAKDAGEVVLIDVRTPAEFADGHAPGAVNIPLDALQARMSELEPHKKADLYLICRSGARSGRAQSMLASAGFENPINIAGGTLAWKSAGYPVE